MKKINKIKQEKKRFADKYWKLSAIERIDYDNRLNEINKNYKFIVSKMYLKFFLSITLFSLLLSLVYDSTTFVTLSRNIMSYMFNYMIIPVIIDLILIIISLFSEPEEIAKLNRRFKLC